MDTHYKELPFKLTFFQYNKPSPILNFYPNELDGYKNEINVKLVENVDISVLFNSHNKDIRLYMDGLESLPEQIVEEDENGGIFRYPSPEKFNLYTNDYYPLIPGHYRIMIVTDSNKYYSSFQVIPKQVTQAQWEIMRSELESELKGLAQDLVRKNLGIGIRGAEGIPVAILYRFLVIRKYFNSLMVSISDLMTKVNFRIKKEYKTVQSDQAKVIDEITIKYRLSHPENEDLFRVPVRQIEYDLIENRWIKKIIKLISLYLNEFILSAERYCETLNSEISDLKKYSGQSTTILNIREKQKVVDYLFNLRDLAYKMKNSIMVIERASWYQYVSQLRSTEVSPILMSDPRYRVFYKIYRTLELQNNEIILDKSYSYQWKRTDKLYEIWGFIKLYKALAGQELQFEVKSGWIFDSNQDENNILIPTLLPDTTIVLKREDLKLHLIYDSVIPLSSNDTSLEKAPIFMQGTHNRPDCRIDIFKKGIYIGSLMIDFKYRAEKSFWNVSLVKSVNRPNTMGQLIAYASQCKSPYLFGDGARELYMDINPVSQVLAISPNTEGEPGYTIHKDHNLTLVGLCPGQANSHIAVCLKNSINNIEERANRFLKYFKIT